MKLRLSTISDLACVDELLARSYPVLLKPDYPPSVLVTALPLISRAQPDLLACGSYYVVIEDGEVLGAGGWTPDKKDATTGHIRHVVTDHRHLRRGIGGWIIRHSLKAASDAGVEEMICWSTRTAKSFYMAMGFESLGPMTVSLQAGITFPAVRMIQRL